jgi:lipid II:glycine glycyltransferase (peptidoglycan interpeptide bridge formation enzyme)
MIKVQKREILCKPVKTMISYNIKLIDPFIDARWDSFVQSHPFGTIYQHSSWMKVLALTYQHTKPLCFAIEDKEGNIRGAIPSFIVKSKLTGTRIVSLPFTSYCDPLVDNKKDLVKLLDPIVKETENISASYYELRTFWNQDLIEDDRFKQHNYHKIHILDVQDGFEQVKRSFPKDIVKSMNKAMRCGLTLKQGSTEHDLKEFYFMHALMRRRLGFPIQPYQFFKNMWDILYPQGYLELLLATWNKSIIAGIILFKFKGIVTYEFGSPLQKYLDKKPNHFLLWSAIEKACSEGYHYFDFGKSPPDHKGLLDFKKRWGAKMYDLPYFYYPQVKGMMSLEQDSLKHKFLRSMGKYVPLPLAKIIGRFAYHHLG